MTEDLQATEDLLRELMGTIIAHPDELLIDRKEHAGSVYFGVTAHGNDTPALVGKQGCHVKAFGKILAAIGESNDEIYILTLREPKLRRDRETQHARPEKVASYNSANAAHLLGRILVAAGLPDTALETVYSPHPKYESPKIAFRIFTRSEDDYGRLVANDCEDGHNLSLVGAIGTVFRAYANREGVEFNIEVVKP